jgi:hypothetical protein
MELVPGEGEAHIKPDLRGRARTTRAASRVRWERRERGMGARQGGESGSIRETIAGASEAKNEQQAALFVGREKNTNTRLEAWAEGQRKGRSEGRPAAG